MSPDLIVIGGGPAGCATALTAARRGASVLLLERSAGPIRKVCGEFLSFPGVEAAARLGVVLADAPRMTAVRIRRGDRVVGFAIDPAAAGIRRARLDGELLARAAEGGVRVVRGARRVTCRPGDGWDVTWKEEPEGRKEAARAPRLVLATGRTTSATDDAWVGYRSRYSTRAGSPLPAGDERTTLELALLGSDHYYGRGAVDDGSVTETHLVRRSRMLADVRRPDEVAAIDIATPPFRMGRIVRPGAKDVFPVGDAMAAWPPLVGDGMTAAMLAGERLGAAIVEPGFNTLRWHRDWEKEFGERLRNAMRLHRAILSEVGSTALMALGAGIPGLAARIGRSVRLGG